MNYPKDRARRDTPEHIRFWSCVDFGTDVTGCWTWRRALNSAGYGYFVFHGREWRAHRRAYEFWFGEVPAGMVLDHLCRNRACCRPDHLEPVTIGENVRRGVHRTAGLTHCKNGHPFAIRGNRKICRTCHNESVRRSRERRRQS